ncbi:hypothetical protein AB1L88_03475 [Tautonia sp. JC769]|uniref:hypothetical protein n=1 Tax=Tautonia sp. JC769 TaxID=3232135 RepID=UPI003457A9BF
MIRRVLWVVSLAGFVLSDAPSVLAQSEDTFEVMLVKGVAVDLEEDSDEIFFKVDGEHRRGQPDGDGDYIRFGGSHPTTRAINQTLFTDKAAGYSTTFELWEQDREPVDPHEHLGTCKITINAAGRMVIEPIKGVVVKPEPEDNMLVVTFNNTDGCIYQLYFRKIRIEAP